MGTLFDRGRCWVAVGCLVPLLAGLLACAGAGQSSRKPARSTEKQRDGCWAREDFEKVVLGKTREQVMELLGGPDSVPEDGRSNGGRVVWQYDGITVKPPARRLDVYVRVWFEYDMPRNVAGGQPASTVEYSDGYLTGGR